MILANHESRDVENAEKVHSSMEIGQSVEDAIDENRVKIRAIVKRWGRQRRLIEYQFEEVAPHVRKFVTGNSFQRSEASEILMELSQYGYDVHIEIEYVDVSALEMIDLFGDEAE